MRLENKIAIVTGAAAGIGAATARLFAKEGAKVVVADFDGAGAETIAAGLGNSATAVRVDVRQASSVRDMIAATKAAFGRLDILVNNAGKGVMGTVVTTEEAAWDDIMATNLKSVYLCSKHAIPLMREGGGGTIVNTASNVAQVGIPNRAAYVASKVLVLGGLTLLQSLALLALVSLRCPLGVEPGAWLIASGTLAMGGICAMLLGLMLSAWSANPDQSITTAALVLLLLVVFSGLVPLERLAGGLQLFASVNPLRWSYGGLCGTALLEDRFTQNGIERLLHDVLKTSPRQALSVLTALAMGLYGMTYVALILRSDRDRQR